MGHRLIERDEHGRRKVDLFRLSRWLQLAIALGVVGAVVLMARVVDPDASVPPWMPTATRVMGWAYLGLVIVTFVSWWLHRRG